MAAEALSTVAIVGRACTTPASGMVLRARPSGLDRVHGFRLCRLMAVSLFHFEERESIDVFLVESSPAADILSLAPDERGVSRSLEWALCKTRSELRALFKGLRCTRVELESKAAGLSLSFRMRSLAPMPLGVRLGDSTAWCGIASLVSTEALVESTGAAFESAEASRPA